MTGRILISRSKSSGQKRIGSHACRNLLENRLPAFTFEQLEARELLTYTPTPHPYPGISFIQYSITFSSTQSADINIAEIDLSTPGLNLQTTIKGDTPDTIAKTNLNYINDEHAQLAVNGNFFTPVPHSSNVSVDLYGFAASLIVADAQSGHTGTVVSPYQSNTSPIDYAVMPYAPAINIATPLNHSTNLVASIVHYDAAHPQSNLPAEVYNGSVELGNALSGSAQIIIDCPPIPPSTDPTPCINPDIQSGPTAGWNALVRARTAMGISRDGTKLVLFTADSSSTQTGMTVPQVVTELLKLQAPYNIAYAINLDGGGSTNMAGQNPASGGRDYINHPSDASRALGNSIAFFAPAPAAPLSLAATSVNGSGNSTITWASPYGLTNNYGDTDKITIERSTDSVNWTVITSTALANALTYTATGLAQNTSYYFRAKVSNAAFASPSPYSNTAVIETVTQTFTGGALVINGTTHDDLLDVSWDGTYVTVHGVRLSPNAPAANVTSILVNGGAGNDTIDLSLVNSGHGFNESALFGHITVQGDAGDDIITGSNIASAGTTIDRLFGGDGADNIIGGAGNDILIGGNGRDTLVGGADNDTADYSANTSSQSVNISLNGAADDNDGLGTSNESVDVETVLGGAGNDILTGGSGNDYLKGNDGSDTIDGGAGNDTLYGDAGSDRIHGGDGDDSIHGGTGDDALFGDRIAYGGAGSPGNDVIWGDEGNDDIVGGHWAITSNDGNDRMYGGSGSDRFYEVGGNQGNDIITDDQQDVPTDIDWITFSGWSNSITLHLDSAYVGVQQNLVGGGSLTLTTLNSIENIWAGSGNDYLYGDGRANYLDGQQGDDHIWGGAGNDSLAGYDGYDYLYGEADNDLMWPEYGGGEMYGGTGNDTYDFVMTYGNNYFVYEDAIVGGPDGSSDTLDFTGSTGPVVLDLANSTTGQSFAGITLKLNDGMGIENVYCSQNTAFNWGDTLYGNARPNILKGGVGNDFIYGRAGADTLFGEDGNDYLDPGGPDGAADSISGGNGDDTLVNHDGPDVWDTIEHVL